MKSRVTRIKGVSARVTGGHQLSGAAWDGPVDHAFESGQVRHLDAGERAGGGQAAS